MNSSALIQPLMASIAALSVGVPALDMERVMPYIGSSSLKDLEAYIANDPTDHIEDIVHSDNFDIYAIVNVNGKNIVFGCVQAKTSIRDRVGRDREFSARIMERNFWSVAVVLDGTYLAMPKFEKMVNGGGTTQYTENGWHGMYAMSNAEEKDRIYSDKTLDLLIDDARQAAEKFTSARQRFTSNWQALHS